QEHRRSLADHQDRHDIFHLPVAQGQNVWVVGWAFDAMIPALVVVVPVLIVLEIGLVVLIVVGNQIRQRKAVMGGDEVDRGNRPPVFIQVGRAENSLRYLADFIFIALDEAAN